MIVSLEAFISAANDDVGLDRSALVRRLRRVDTVIFDCDSTLSTIEGIDELARDRYEEVARLTAAAMRGEVPLEEVYGERLALVAPSRQDVLDLGALYIDTIVEDAAETIRGLQGEGIQVRIMSGGLRPAVELLAAKLGIQTQHVAAVDAFFDEEGRYTGFEDASPLARAGGKRLLLEALRRELKGPVMFVGDGATDLETQDVADVFVAFAGVVERAAVVESADIVVRSASLAPILPLALGGHPPRLAAALPTYNKGLDLLESVYRSYLANGTST